jgi:di/tricarboxylate transporter
MTPQIAFLLAVLAVMVWLFLTEKLPVDLTAFAGLVVLIFTGYVSPSQAFEGFASSAVITMLAIFIVSAALLHTGLAETVADRIHAVVGGREVPLIVALMLIAGVLSAFMNNIAATAVLMPAVAALATRARISPSRLFMPLAFGAILGGTTTLVGTPPNIVAGELLRERGMEPFGLFDFTPVGLTLLAVGTLFMATAGRRLLPERATSGAGSGAGGADDLPALYQVRDKLFTLRLSPDSALDGHTLGETRLGQALRVKVISIGRGGRRLARPGGDTVLHGGDVLLVQGRREHVHELLQLREASFEHTTFDDLPPPGPGAGGVRARLLPGSPQVGRTLRELDFRRRHRLVVVAIRRGERLIPEDLGDLPLAAEDVILALGTRERIEALADRAEEDGLVVEATGFRALEELRERIFLLRVPPGSALAGATLAATRIRELVGLTIGGIVRGGELLPALSARQELAPGDRLVIVGDPDRVATLHDLGDVELEAVSEGALEREDTLLVEAAVAPRSAAAGKTLRQLDFQNRYGLLALSIWRQGGPIHGDLADLPLALGDALLLQGRRRRIAALVADPDFVVLSRVAQTPRRTNKAPFALGGLLLMVALVVTGWQPIHVAAFTAATAVVLAGAVTMEEAYRAIEWRAIFLVAAVLPVGGAMERTGAAELLAGTVGTVAGPLGPYAVLAALVVLSSLLSQGLDGAPAVVLLTPVVLETAAALGLSPLPLMMGVALAASAAFMTPFSHKANLLVMGAGGYRSMDYVRVGSPLTVVLLALMVLLVPLVFPF